MAILENAYEFWLEGGLEPVLHPISYYKLMKAVSEAKRTIQSKIEKGESIEEVAEVLASQLPTVHKLGHDYIAGIPLPSADYVTGDHFGNTKRSLRRLRDAPTRREMQVHNLNHEVWQLLYLYGKSMGLDTNQVGELVTTG